MRLPLILVVLGTAWPAGQERTLVLEGGTLVDGTGKSAIADAVCARGAVNSGRPEARQPTGVHG